ncbi:FtsX-like permease family protein [Propionimicrobium lymphophilum]|uniref:FtsX-like permease family protein n=1 Tax=Propionimicrobium lymphophilum TaxID=33012 RepID=UPI00254CA2AF|nr:FtsX-like permease family protein [Propionimicrobium lymphophilum]MDK7710521.1 FtsX-like permease family protein [Propionimicrobium lymphophilum]MDK7734457.1 FtsX-like permease family protein [Propionimicrobium lymphophilum]
MPHTPHITVGALPSRNLKRNPFRTAMLVVVVAILSFGTFAGSLLLANLNSGLESVRQRLGADLMLVPAQSLHQAEAVISAGEPSTFYFSHDVFSTVQKMPGVKRATQQFYISSLEASCCDSKLQIVGFDPKTDFIIEPWIKTQYDGNLPDGKIIVGSNVMAFEDETLKLFNHEWPVAAKLASTGTDKDNSVFVNPNTAKLITSYAAQMGEKEAQEAPEGAASTVFADVQDGYSLDEVARQVTEHKDLQDVSVISGVSLTSKLKSSINSIANYVLIFLILFWVIGLIVQIAVFASSANSRKAEFATLRILGATRRNLVSMVTEESSLIGLLGGVIGVGLGALTTVSFSTLIGRSFGMPYAQVGAAQVIVLALGVLAFAMVTCMISSAVSTARMMLGETYLTLRAGA